MAADWWGGTGRMLWSWWCSSQSVMVECVSSAQDVDALAAEQRLVLGTGKVRADPDRAVVASAGDDREAPHRDYPTLVVVIALHHGNPRRPWRRHDHR